MLKILSFVFNTKKFADVCLMSLFYLYDISNVWLWYFLNYWMQETKKLRNEINSRELILKIKVLETRFIVTIVIFEFWYILFNVIAIIKSNGSLEIQQTFYRITYQESSIIYFILLFWQIILLSKFSSIYQASYINGNNLESQYFVMKLNSVYFLLLILFNIPFIIWNLDDSKMIWINSQCYNNLIRVIFLIFWTIMQMMLILYIYYNFKFISYKEIVLSLNKSRQISQKQSFSFLIYTNSDCIHR